MAAKKTSPPKAVDATIARGIGERLSTKTDELNKALEAAESYLMNLNLGVSGEVDITEEDDDDRCVVYLTWEKRAAHWALFWVVRSADEDDKTLNRIEVSKGPKAV